MFSYYLKLHISDYLHVHLCFSKTMIPPFKEGTPCTKCEGVSSFCNDGLCGRFNVLIFKSVLCSRGS